MIFSCRFRVEDESKQFRLSVGDYRGNATDSLSLHDGKMFSTHDRDNDEVASCCNCADTFKGGWWYYRSVYNLRSSKVKLQHQSVKITMVRKLLQITYLKISLHIFPALVKYEIVTPKRKNLRQLEESLT